ncbi:orotidine-5'-phosphate decarboxylase [Tetragenococcus halophilus]|uniref:orotidine-5'-phosphate decarboxylase n=1 Tax=Tetragenococcus halophilus TaxID=51669 RepID=UPI001F15A042|nr:orotidine-5'-phosphate decarboxylase [Tetragenococcus halophilus]MCF1685941.1 orotidine-5'-phosphate decarboxylase [Tetragenococcus halophilus]
MIERPIIALDFSSKAEIKTFLNKFPQDESLFVKVGMEIFYQEGPAIVEWLKKAGHDIFLDLKLHDIPNTVQRSMIGLAKMGVAITTIQAAGGSQMMQEAKQGLDMGTPAGQTSPQVIAVTQLTSTSQAQMQKEQLVQASLEESVLHYAKGAQEAGLDGVVCSAWEAQKIHDVTSENFMCLTPGIRPHGKAADDQKRVVSPSQAYLMGSNAIVVGRPITLADDPYKAYQNIKTDWNDIADE